jgi:AraC-like DNA-binding protein
VTKADWQSSESRRTSISHQPTHRTRQEFAAERKLSVTEIGLDVGFSETSSFTSAYRKVTGETPSDYRRSLA